MIKDSREAVRRVILTGSEGEIPPEKLVEMFRTMLLIREVEESLRELGMRGLVQGFLHISVGPVSYTHLTLPTTERV